VKTQADEVASLLVPYSFQTPTSSINESHTNHPGSDTVTSYHHPYAIIYVYLCMEPSSYTRPRVNQIELVTTLPSDDFFEFQRHRGDSFPSTSEHQQLGLLKEDQVTFTSKVLRE